MSEETEVEARYSSCTVFMLDRETGNVQSAMMYPVTRIHLNDIREGVNVVRAFVVDDAGRWAEVQ